MDNNCELSLLTKTTNMPLFHMPCVFMWRTCDRPSLSLSLSLSSSFSLPIQFHDVWLGLSPVCVECRPYLSLPIPLSLSLPLSPPLSTTSLSLCLSLPPSLALIQFHYVWFRQVSGPVCVECWPWPFVE